MLKKVCTVDVIEVTENGCVQVRTRTSIMEDGKQISASYHRHVINPGDDYSCESDRVRAVCGAVHTDELIKTYVSSKSLQGV